MHCHSFFAVILCYNAVYFDQNLLMSQSVVLSNPNNPWYKNYMLLIFVIGLPLLVAVVCVFFIVYAVNHQDSTVRDDWYMDGKALYQDASKDQLAADLGVSGIMRFEGSQVRFELKYQTPNIAYPTTLNANISHATDKSKDRDFVLTHQADNVYVGEVALDTAIVAKYYIQVQPNSEHAHDKWRLIQPQRLPAKAVGLNPLKAFERTQTP